MNTLLKAEDHSLELNQAILMANDIVDRNYLMRLPEQTIQVFNEIDEMFTINKHLRVMKLMTLVYEQEENITDKLTTMFNAISHMNGTVSLIINSDGANVDLYMAVRTNTSDQEVYPIHDLFQKSFESQFQGSSLKTLSNSKTKELFDSVLHNESDLPSIVSVCGVPSKKSLQQAQGIDRLIESMQGEVFSALIIGKALSLPDIANLRSNYAALYTELSPLRQTTRTFGKAESSAITEGMTKGLTKTATSTISHSSSKSFSESKTNTKGITHTGSMNAGFQNNTSGGNSFSIGGSYSQSRSTSESISESKSTTTGTSTSVGDSIGQSSGQSVSVAATSSLNEALQLTFENKTVTEMLKKLDLQLERISDAEDYGMWEFAAYFIAENPKVAQIAGQTYRSVIRGENSSVEQGALLHWEERQIREMTRYLQILSHPVFRLKTMDGQEIGVKPTSLIHGEEVTLALHLPQKSLKNVPIVRIAEFGRNVQSVFEEDHGKAIEIGYLQHFGKIEKQRVHLNINQLASHTFVSGATGSGKSNAMYQIINGLRHEGIKLLVIEPAKGEYRHVYGHLSDVSVYGTNVTQGELLRINPFVFPKGIHIQEHLDRLIEIISACWPLYAAMPAILKRAIAETYERCGWILDSSEFIGKRVEYPTFKDLLDTLPYVIHSYGFSKEVEDNYKGSLIARVESMTNGIIGPLFHEDSLSDESLFNENVIIDLSRIGSVETKSLIMGILFLKLHEFRMISSDVMNSPLRHVTILEEAHHLLRNMSGQSEGSLQQKAIEMITNSIAEMRSFGQGFIIVDQSPSAVDPTAIKNTNTKIIMRIPDADDRNRLGRSVGLNDEQINEISKLRPGNAIVHQSTWLQPVIVKIHHQQLEGKQKVKQIIANNQTDKMLLKLLIKQSNSLTQEEVNDLIQYVEQLKIKEIDRKSLCRLIEDQRHQLTPVLFSRHLINVRSRLLYELGSGDKILKYSLFGKNDFETRERLKNSIQYFIGTDADDIQEIVKLLLHYQKGVSK